MIQCHTILFSPASLLYACAEHGGRVMGADIDVTTLFGWGKTSRAHAKSKIRCSFNRRESARFALSYKACSLYQFTYKCCCRLLHFYLKRSIFT